MTLEAKALHFGLILGTLIDLGYTTQELQAMFSASNIKKGVAILNRAKEAK